MGKRGREGDYRWIIIEGGGCDYYDYNSHIWLLHMWYCSHGVDPLHIEVIMTQMRASIGGL